MMRVETVALSVQSTIRSNPPEMLTIVNDLRDMQVNIEQTIVFFKRFTTNGEVHMFYSGLGGLNEKDLADEFITV